MKKLQVVLLVAATSAMVITGCSKKDTALTTSDSVHNPAAESADIETVIPDAAPKEGMVRSKVTNEWIDEELYDQRPLAVMIPNEASAIPHYGISEASVLYECNVEGNMTRMMAIFEDYESIKKLGNIRSLRDYYTYWAFEWDAVICCYGGPYYIDEIMARSTTDSLNGSVLSNNPFFRSSDRKLPHNAYLNGSLIKAALEKQNIEIYDRGLADEAHYSFAKPSEPNTLNQYSSAETASYVDMSSCYPVTRCYFEYNEEDGLYYRSQHLDGSTDGPHIDGANNEQLTFSNILIESHDYAARDTIGYLWYETVDSGRDAWYITQGKLIKCTWEKTSEFSATRYYDENGNEITLNTGKTMILIIQDGDTFNYK